MILEKTINSPAFKYVVYALVGIKFYKDYKNNNKKSLVIFIMTTITMMNVRKNVPLALIIGLIVSRFGLGYGKISENFTKIYAVAKGEICGLEWDGHKGGTGVGSNERHTKWDCGGNADPITIENGKIYASAGDDKCGLEWDGHKEGSLVGNNERLAKWDCGGSADPITIEDGKIYAMASGEKCGLEWDGHKGGEVAGANERQAKWDCGGSADPLIFEDNGRVSSCPGWDCTPFPEGATCRGTETNPQYVCRNNRWQAHTTSCPGWNCTTEDKTCKGNGTVANPQYVCKNNGWLDLNQAAAGKMTGQCNISGHGESTCNNNENWKPDSLIVELLIMIVDIFIGAAGGPKADIAALCCLIFLAQNDGSCFENGRSLDKTFECLLNAANLMDIESAWNNLNCREQAIFWKIKEMGTDKLTEGALKNLPGKSAILNQLKNLMKHIPVGPLSKLINEVRDKLTSKGLPVLGKILSNKSKGAAANATGVPLIIDFISNQTQATCSATKYSTSNVAIIEQVVRKLICCSESVIDGLLEDLFPGKDKSQIVSAAMNTDITEDTDNEKKLNLTSGISLESIVKGILGAR